MRPFFDEDHRRRLYQGVLQLEGDDIVQILPHRYPMILVDRILSLVPNEHAVGQKQVTGNEYCLKRRISGFVFPSTLALEALGQVAALALLYDDARLREHASDAALRGCSTKGAAATIDQRLEIALAGVQHVEIHREVVEPETLHLTTHIQSVRRGMARIQGQALASGRPYLDATFYLALSKSQ